jgi:hypothetical protein
LISTFATGFCSAAGDSACAAGGLAGGLSCVNAAALEVNINMGVSRDNMFIGRVKTRRLCRGAEELTMPIQIISRLIGRYIRHSNRSRRFA